MKLIDWLHSHAEYFHKSTKLEEAVHAAIDAYVTRGWMTRLSDTDIEGLVWMPLGKNKEQELVLSNMRRRRNANAGTG